MSELVDPTILALAEPTRLRIVEMLSERPRRVGEIARALDMSGPAISRHLRVLRTNGLIEEIPFDDDARVRIYRLRQAPFAELHAWVERVESFWEGQLAAFKEHAEQERGGS